MSTLRIDAHQHYWHPARGDYDWMPMDNPVLARPYGPADLAPALAKAGISKTVLVQAAASVEETDYLLGIADATPSVGAVVGWIDFENSAHLKHLQRLKSHPKFAGVRPMIQDIADVDWMLRKDVQWAFAALADLDLTFDALGFSRHLANFLTIFKRYPNLRVVVDHCMKPQIRDHETARNELAFWSQGMSRIAGETSAFCKLSGIVTEANEDWAATDLEPYVSHVVKAFSPSRIMWGSDWPVCRLRSEYEDWMKAAQTLTAHLQDSEKAEVFGGAAARFYRLSAP
jgi:L-fuconolactonase